jgi:peptide chain release factor 1
MTHKPTGITIRVETKSQHRNREIALGILRARLFDLERSRSSRQRNNRRRDQVGSGMRADKVRTIALQRGQVTDHQTGRRTSAKKYLRGFIDDLWP